MQRDSRLFKTAVEMVQITAEASAMGYWRLRVAARRSGEQWSGAEVETFEMLSAREALDALASTLELMLDPSAND